MSAADMLEKFRKDGYGSDPDKKVDEDGYEKNSTSRIIKLSDDEVKMIGDRQPGDDITLKVSGNLEEDGHFHVMTVSLDAPTEGDQDPEKQMASQVAQKVMPNILPSPS